MAPVAAAPPPADDGAAAGSLPVLGWKERIALPDWEIPTLRAKLDTGARTSALHVTDLTLIDASSSDHDHPLARFRVVLARGEDPPTREITAPVVGYRTVRDTGAKTERRPVVRTRIVCGPLDRLTEITITDRSGMNFRMIVGRTTLQGACLVDPERGYLHSLAPRRRPVRGLR